MNLRISELDCGLRLRIRRIELGDVPKADRARHGLSNQSVKPLDQKINKLKPRFPAGNRTFPARKVL